MPFQFLPSLGSLAAGIASGIPQRSQRAEATLKSFAANTTMLGIGADLDNRFEFDRLYAETPEGTPVLNKFDAILQNTNSPTVGVQALLAQAAAAQPIAERARQNPLFAFSQGVPGSFEAQLRNGYLGTQANLDDRSNLQRLAIAGQAPQPSDALSQMTALLQAFAGLSNTSAAQGNTELVSKEVFDLRQKNAELQRTIAETKQTERDAANQAEIQRLSQELEKLRKPKTTAQRELGDF